MATLGTLTNYLENKLINHLLLNVDYTPPASVWLALYTASPSDTGGGTEVISVGNYARQRITFNVSANIATNSSIIYFPEATTNWGTIVAASIMDAVTNGNMLFWGEITNHTEINTGENYTINPSALNVELRGGDKGGWGDDVPERILKYVLTGVNFNPGGIYIALGNNLSEGIDNSFVSWTETNGTGYSRKKISGSSLYSPISGSTTNLSDVVFSAPPISANWGLITHVVIFDASSSGNALMWGKLQSPIYITAGDGLKFEAGNIDITLN